MNVETTVARAGDAPAGGSMYEYDADDRDVRSFGRAAVIGGGVVALAAIGWFVVRPPLTDGGDDAVGSSSTTETSIGVQTTVTRVEDPTTTSDPATAVVAPESTIAATTTAVTTTTAAPTTTVAPTTAAPTTVAPTTTAAVTAPYETLPDGSPLPVIATFDTNRITLEGVVPDQAASDRLQALAVANAKPGQADTVDNRLTLNPAVPRNVGVRVLELTSARFPAGSSEILPPHAAELDRVVTIMNALPNVTTMVIGHADQRGDDLSNYAISEARAAAVKNYITAGGIAPSRLSSRAVGESDLLTIANDESALALNRRTEFIFYGLLIG
jgi:outer membrane protein OmpA-like peptidoglycan-associated protein